MKLGHDCFFGVAVCVIQFDLNFERQKKERTDVLGGVGRNVGAVHVVGHRDHRDGFVSEVHVGLLHLFDLVVNFCHVQHHA